MSCLMFEPKLFAPTPVRISIKNIIDAFSYFAGKLFRTGECNVVEKYPPSNAHSSGMMGIKGV